MSDLAKEPADGSVGGAKEHGTLADARRIVAATTKKLASMHKNQVHRDPWPDFEAFDVARYPVTLRRAAAWQWISRAQAEHGSVHQFSAVTHALTEARAPMELLGALARLITDEVRHVEVCARIALTMYPEGNDTFFQWRTPRAPWADAPRIDPNDREASELRLRGWATRAILPDPQLLGLQDAMRIMRHVPQDRGEPWPGCRAIHRCSQPLQFLGEGGFARGRQRDPGERACPLQGNGHRGRQA